MRLAAMCAMFLLGCRQAEGPVVLSEGWRVCAIDLQRSCSSCTLTYDEAYSLAMAHAAEHSSDDDELYYFEPCYLMEGEYGEYGKTRRRDQ